MLEYDAQHPAPFPGTMYVLVYGLDSNKKTFHYATVQSKEPKSMLCFVFFIILKTFYFREVNQQQ